MNRTRWLISGYGASMLAFLLALTYPADAAMLKVGIDGMTCIGCQSKVVEALDGLDGISETEASMAAEMACAKLEGESIPDEVRETIEKLGYTITTMDIVDACDTSNTRFPDNWAETGGLDVTIISRGEEVELEAHRPKGTWTIYDFGAPWCAPCHVAEKMIKMYLEEHPDTAVRAIVLDSQTAKESFEMPVVKQHLLSAPGLPYFIVMDDKGKVVFRGSEIDRMLKKLDKKR